MHAEAEELIKADCCVALETAIQDSLPPALESHKLPLPISNNFTGADTCACALLVDKVLTEEECQSLIALTEPHFAWPDQCVDRSGVRRAERCIIDSSHAAAKLFERLQSMLPTELPAPAGSKSKRWRLVGLNPRLRFLRYHSNDYFAPHCDGPYVERADMRSMMTLMLYLDGGASGGEV